jgi:signal transduction histidine kinase
MSNDSIGMKELHYIDQLEKALEKQKEFSRLRSQFITLAIHEFRTPLTVMKSSVEICILESNKTKSPDVSIERFKKHFDRINREIDRLDNLLDNVLNAEMANEGFVKADLKEWKVKVLMENLLEDYIDKEIIIYQNELPDEFTYSLDQDLMYQVLSNLISNAIKYGKDDSKPTVAVELIDRSLLIKVQDDGIGIPKKDQPHILQPFYRASNSKGKTGFGLGLVVAKRFVELQHGQLTFSSKKNHGTAFCITFKL